MKQILFVAMAAVVLFACSGPTDVKLSEMNQPENAKKLLETLSPEDRSALQSYVIEHTMRNDIDYKMTVREAIEARKKEMAQIQNVRDAIK